MAVLKKKLAVKKKPVVKKKAVKKKLAVKKKPVRKLQRIPVKKTAKKVAEKKKVAKKKKVVKKKIPVSQRERVALRKKMLAKRRKLAIEQRIIIKIKPKKLPKSKEKKLTAKEKTIIKKTAKKAIKKSKTLEKIASKKLRNSKQWENNCRITHVSKIKKTGMGYYHHGPHRGYKPKSDEHVYHIREYAPQYKHLRFNQSYGIPRENVLLYLPYTIFIHCPTRGTFHAALSFERIKKLDQTVIIVPFTGCLSIVTTQSVENIIQWYWASAFGPLYDPLKSCVEKWASLSPEEVMKDEMKFKRASGKYSHITLQKLVRNFA